MATQSNAGTVSLGNLKFQRFLNKMFDFNPTNPTLLDIFANQEGDLSSSFWHYHAMEYLWNDWDYVSRISYMISASHSGYDFYAQKLACRLCIDIMNCADEDPGRAVDLSIYFLEHVCLSIDRSLYRRLKLKMSHMLEVESPHMYIISYLDFYCSCNETTPSQEEVDDLFDLTIGYSTAVEAVIDCLLSTNLSLKSVELYLNRLISKTSQDESGSYRYWLARVQKH